MKEVFKTGYLKETAANAFSAFAFADMSHQVTASTSLLPLEPWEIAMGKVVAAAAVSGYYVMTLGAQRHANEGRSRFEKRLVNFGLAMLAPAVAFTDYLLICKAPF